jgi:phosphoglycolate phosphatase-like HAD superfamily hydrolase
MILALDFDGVVCDSVRETLETSARAISEFSSQGEPHLVIGPSEEAEFLRYRKYVGPPGEYLILWKGIVGEIGFRSYEDFRKLSKQHAKECESFANLFFKERQRSKTENLQRWLGLHSFYREVSQTLRVRSVAEKAFIVTTKDCKSVQMLLATQGLVFSEHQIYGYEAGLTKPECLSEILSSHADERVLFVDDHPTYVQQCGGVEGVTSLLADWGYWSGDTLDFTSDNEFHHIQLQNFSSYVMSQVAA